MRDHHAASPCRSKSISVNHARSWFQLGTVRDVPSRVTRRVGFDPAGAYNVSRSCVRVGDDHPEASNARLRL